MENLGADSDELLSGTDAQLVTELARILRIDALEAGTLHPAPGSNLGLGAAADGVGASHRRDVTSGGGMSTVGGYGVTGAL